jgi:phosphatidate cytidylyltransferase
VNGTRAPRSELATRVIIGVALIILAVGDIWLGGVWFWMLATAAALLMLSEYAPLLGATPFQRKYMLYAMCIPLGIVSPLALGPDFIAFGSLGGIAIAVMIVTKRAGLANGILYVGIPMFCLLWLRERPDNGLLYALWALSLVWATDIGAYFAGRAIGGPKIAPSISPSKTWAGLGGGVLLAMLLGWSLNHWAGLPATLALASGLLAVFAQAGDFLESWLKRRAGVKDSGTLLPGHGGVLDRLDGVVTSMPFAAFLVAMTSAT